MNDNTVLIGKKPFMNYVTAVVLQLKSENVDKVSIKARGKYICKAVDVAEMVRKRFLKDEVELDNINVDSEEKENNQGKRVRISVIEITLKKKK
ncbi:MAG TPA: DNA-binding protein Alba [Nautiliaceae bacterium]|nr:DNA-binding protein Alba [Nautiliaceae bacterium]